MIDLACVWSDSNLNQVFLPWNIQGNPNLIPLAVDSLSYEIVLFSFK